MDLAGPDSGPDGDAVGKIVLTVRRWRAGAIAAKALKAF
jgi:hypothetical protein